jgi:inhibitor of cysteine peptidase
VAVLHVDERNAADVVKMALGDILEVSLPENPTTGYRWSMTMDDKHVVAEAIEEPSRGRNPHGATGLHRWHLRASHLGRTEISFALSRSWEAKAPLKRIIVAVNVK